MSKSKSKPPLTDEQDRVIADLKAVTLDGKAMNLHRLIARAEAVQVQGFKALFSPRPLLMEHPVAERFNKISTLLSIARDIDRKNHHNK